MTQDIKTLVERLRGYDGFEGGHSDTAGANAYELIAEAADALERLQEQSLRNYDDASRLAARLDALSPPQAVEALRYAESLAVSLAKKVGASPEWRPLTGDLIGLLTQIDNTTTGLYAHPHPAGDAPSQTDVARIGQAVIDAWSTDLANAPAYDMVWVLGCAALDAFMGPIGDELNAELREDHRRLSAALSQPSQTGGEDVE